MKLLKLFLFAQPEEAFYVRQLSRQLDLQLNSVRRNLAKSEGDIGLLKVKNDNHKADKNFIRLTKIFIFQKKLRTLFAKAEVGQEDKLVHDLQKLGSIDLLVLAAFFINDPSAPTDILIVSNHFNKNKLSDLVNSLEQASGHTITLMSKEEFNYRENMADIFLYKFYGHEKIVINKLLSGEGHNYFYFYIITITQYLYWVVFMFSTLDT